MAGKFTKFEDDALLKGLETGEAVPAGEQGLQAQRLQRSSVRPASRGLLSRWRESHNQVTCDAPALKVGRPGSCCSVGPPADAEDVQADDWPAGVCAFHGVLMLLITFIFNQLTLLQEDQTSGNLRWPLQQQAETGRGAGSSPSPNAGVPVRT